MRTRISELRRIFQARVRPRALAHLGSGSGGGGIDALIARDRREHPVIWASHVEGVLRDGKSRDPLCITETATPDNLIPGLAFVPGRTLLGAIAAWLIAEGERNTASLLTSGQVSVSDALPLPQAPANLATSEVLPAPLTLQSEKPKGTAGDVPWWAQANTPTPRLDAWNAKEKLKRPEDDLFIYRASANDAWTTLRPARRVRLRNGRPDPKQPDASLFAIEQIVEKAHFLAEVQGTLEDMKRLADKLGPILDGSRWLRVGRAGAPVEVAQLAWANKAKTAKAPPKARLTLTSDLLVRDDLLRWRTALDEAALRELVGSEDISITRSECGERRALQDSVSIHGFKGTSRLWRMPAAAIRRGSVFEVAGAGIAKLAERAAKSDWLGERTHEGFGRFSLDEALPGATGDARTSATQTPVADAVEDVIVARTREWFNAHKSLSKFDKKDDNNRKPPSLSQWFDLIADLERGEATALSSRLSPTTAGGKSWEHGDALAVLNKLQALQQQQALHARLFVRWLRADSRKGSSGEGTR